jgi:hypothetical protein
MEAIRSSETSIPTRTTQRNIPEDGIFRFTRNVIDSCQFFSQEHASFSESLYTYILNYTLHVRFLDLTAVTMKNGVLWDVTPRGSCKNRRFGET